MTQEESPAPVAPSPGPGSPGLLVIGAGLIVGGWLVLGLIAGEWNPGALYIALSLIVLLSAYHIAGVKVGVGTQRAIGFFMGLAGLVVLVADLRFGGFPDDIWTILAYIVFLAGCGLMFVGARALAD